MALGTELLKVIIGGDASGATAAMNSANASVKTNVAAIKGELAGLNSALSMVGKITTFGLVGKALLEVGAAAKECVDSTLRFTREHIALGKQLGISANQAVVLVVISKTLELPSKNGRK